LKTEDFLKAVEKSFGQDILGVEKRGEKEIVPAAKPGAIVLLFKGHYAYQFGTEVYHRHGNAYKKRD
jgi:hypothetical protein